MLKFYDFDIFDGSFRTRFEVQCSNLSQALDALSRYCADTARFNLFVCSRYTIHTLDYDGNPVSVRYNVIRKKVPFNVVNWSLTRYDSTIFVPSFAFGRS